MGPKEYESLVAAALKADGYTTELGPYTGDLGVDVFAHRGAERLAVQAKMYGGTTRQVNHECLMQLYGAAAYFDCTGAILATNGTLTPQARLVAQKLNIRVMNVPATSGSNRRQSRSTSDFDGIWEKYVMPLTGRRLTRAKRSSNTILSVDWSGVKRITSSGRHQFIPIEIFRFTVERVLREGSITRDEINEHYTGRASSGITLILAQVPLFEVGGARQTVSLKGQ